MSILKILSLTTITTSLLFSACTITNKKTERKIASVESGIEYDSRRGSPSEYDPGPELNSEWFKLFGQTPNYRAIGVEALNGTAGSDEKFRWEFGPMWYRGRLTAQSVKVFVVGQEGAQDENISNRAFTGSTGTRMQKFLNHLGIYKSYLFLNTFVYTINGQLDDNPNFKWLEQGTGSVDVESSPIVKYRHQLFDQMLLTNNETVALFIGVGAGGKASLATWINARGGKCSTYYELKNCDTSGMNEWFEKNRKTTILNQILAIGVPHPGGANPNLGGSDQLENIKKGFTEAARRVAEFKNKNNQWLPSDSEEKSTQQDLLTRLNSDYIYKGYAPIPFRDFAFNTNWRMGSEGTTSNRWGASSIQVYSDAGEYNNKDSVYAKVSDINSGLNSDKTALLGMGKDDLPYEHPRYTKNLTQDEMNYDYGPCGFVTLTKPDCELSKALVDWPDFNKLGLKPQSHSSFGYFGSYRGHAHNSRVLIIADQTSHDDFFSTRALTGTEGQKIQTLINKLKLQNKYFILRTFPVDTLGLDQDLLKRAATSPSMLDSYERIINAVSEQANLQVVISLGEVASEVSKKIFTPEFIKMNNKFSNVKFVQMKSLANKLEVTAQLKVIASHLQVEDFDASYSFNGELSTIARSDLPAHTRWWMGSSGDRASRGEGATIGDYYRVWSPYWQSKLLPKSLTNEEKVLLSNGLQSLKK